MISFEHIDDFSKKYHFYNFFLRTFHNYLYYKKIYVVNRENIPGRGKPVMVIANHQNGLSDALAILYLFDDSRQPVFIARGDIFKKDRVAKILRFLKILPTFRTRDGGVSDIKKNADSFGMASRVLNHGGTIVMFPEAQHQHGHYMSTFKKGFPRIAFAAEEAANFQLGLQILPLNIHYSDYFNARSKMVITVGKPFTFEEFFEEFKTDPNLAYLALNEKARAHVKEITPDIECWEDYLQECELLRAMLIKPRMKARHADTSYFPNCKEEDLALVNDINHLRKQNPQRFEQLMTLTRDYLAELDRLNLRSWIIGKRSSLAGLLGKSLLYILALPVILFGMITNILPFEFSAIFRKKIKDRMLHSSFNFVASFLSFNIWYILAFVVAWIVSGKVLFALALLIAMFVSFFAFYGCKRSFIKFRAEWRYYFQSRNKETEKASHLKDEILNFDLNSL